MYFNRMRFYDTLCTIFDKKHECIPVGRVPSAAVAVLWGGVCLGVCVCPIRGFCRGGGVFPGECLPRGGVHLPSRE